MQIHSQDVSCEDESRKARSWLALSTGFAIVSITCAAVALCVHVLTHYPFYDECLHVHYAWLVSIGDVPYRDFWCPYPVMGYYLTAPLLMLLPESIWTFFALRFFTLLMTVALGVLFAWHGLRTAKNWKWAVVCFCAVITIPAMARFLAEYSVDHLACLAALCAISLCFAPPTVGRVQVVAALSCVSFLVTPKYPFTLALAGTGFFISACVGLSSWRARLILAVRCMSMFLLAGLVAALGLWLAGVSLIDYMAIPFGLQSRYNLAVRNDILLFALVRFLLCRPWCLALLCTAVLSWSWHTRSRLLALQLGPCGTLLGLCVTVAVVPQWYEQYLWPVLIVLLLFVPYIAMTKMLHTRPRLQLVLLATGALITIGHTWRATENFKRTPLNTRGAAPPDLYVEWTEPALRYMRHLQSLLLLIPPEERVVAIWDHHPLFRRDLTYVTQDETPSKIFSLSSGDPRRETFSTNAFLQALNEHAPAYISPRHSQENMTYGWRDVLRAFMLCHTQQYYMMEFPHGPVFIRADIMFKYRQSRID